MKSRAGRSRRTRRAVDESKRTISWQRSFVDRMVSAELLRRTAVEYGELQREVSRKGGLSTKRLALLEKETQVLQAALEYAVSVAKQTKLKHPLRKNL